MHTDDDILYPKAALFVLVHVACVGAIWTGVTTRALVLCALLYVIRMFAITAGYHRYFSHRSFRTSRWFQFVLALVAQSSTQKGVLWWAACHRQHHRHSDTEHDVHSPRLQGFIYAHFLWVFARANRTMPPGSVRDLVRFPELVFLNRYYMLPPIVLATAIWAIGGWADLVVGFFWSTVLLYHATFAINSLAHTTGWQPYDTRDDSRNNWWLAIITMGEGWHNNHHVYQRSARQGFRWYEVDLTFYILTMLKWVGVVWDVAAPPRAVTHAKRRAAAPPNLAVGPQATDAPGV